jgi:hypothetical protein
VPGIRFFKADVIIFLSCSDGADAGSSRCAPKRI